MPTTATTAGLRAAHAALTTAWADAVPAAWDAHTAGDSIECDRLLALAAELKAMADRIAEVLADTRHHHPVQPAEGYRVGEARAIRLSTRGRSALVSVCSEVKA